MLAVRAERKPLTRNALQYEGGEPCSICGHVMLPAGGKTHDSCMPTTIISGFLYLGSYDTASRQELLRSLNISHILNVSHSAAAASVVPLAVTACSWRQGTDAKVTEPMQHDKCAGKAAMLC